MRVYMKSKPDKYGEMFKTLNDAATAYLELICFPTNPRNSILRKKSWCSQHRVCARFFIRESRTPIHGTHRIVTIDNWFTSIPFIERMLKNPYNLKITGTVTLLSFTPKKNKIVLLASSYTSSTVITNGKPDMIRHYNQMKGGTYTFDQLCTSFSTTKRTNRWPMRIFFGILDQATVNAVILLKCKRLNAGDHGTITAYNCIDDVIKYLVTPHLQERYEIPTLRTDIRYALSGILKADIRGEIRNDGRIVEADTYARVARCISKKGGKTKSRCAACGLRLITR
ncbi:uncharacterized protein LOC117182533, partial [Belonocnema kinseyi]|uniref:uncharacterized protein LOC117182533 n=1 Tax=Belonocnema kinseyi TaxID=2817044 RepID=UPI00143DE947